MHQLVEYVLGAALIAQGMQEPEPLVPTLAGTAILLNAAAVRGPLGAFSVIGRRVHRWLDVGLAVLVVGAALQPWVGIAVTSRAILLVMLLPLGFLWFYTDWAERETRRQRRTAAGSQRAGDVGSELGRTAGRIAAGAYVAGRRAVKKRSDQSPT